MLVSPDIAGRFRRREDVPGPAGFAVFDCETTGTVPGVDEIVSFAVVRLRADGIETARLALLVRPSRPIPAEATAVHGISDCDVLLAPSFAEVAGKLLALLDGAVFVAHNAAFDLAMVRHALPGYRPAGVACTLDAFRMLEPLAENHTLESTCARHGILLSEAHDALADVLATASLLRVVLACGIAPETVEFDRAAFFRLRSRGDMRPATERQFRRVFSIANAAGLARRYVLALVHRVAGIDDLDALTREQVQDVYDALVVPTDPGRRAA
jgi:DNA polymerase III epsilon subunit-like protein